ncbi:MAG TPA: uracil-DNA glycosylase [Nitrososphaeraceae archaeon]|nr:uracil-DNA glycosylase [Nitrososphaeraceae archaeon]
MVTINSINREIIDCVRCKRLVNYTRLVGKNKVRRYSNEEYWAKPVTGFGDTDANVLIIGLAPGAHGANRTGRLFTGDHSGQWLMKALYETGFSNNPSSISAKDGLILKNVFITSCVRCAPPSNKPLNSELVNCSNYLVKELEILKKVRVVITLGHIAFQTYCKIYDLNKLQFYHLGRYRINDKHLIASYHPSRQNTNTKKLTWPMWISVFDVAKTILSSNN